MHLHFTISAICFYEVTDMSRLDGRIVHRTLPRDVERGNGTREQPARNHG